MMQSKVTTIALIAYFMLLCIGTYGYVVEIEAKKQDCFLEYVKTKRTAYLRIAVLDEGDSELDIRLRVYGPFAQPPSDEDTAQNFFDHLVVTKLSEGNTEVQYDGFNFDTEHRGGWYKYCLSNEHSSWSTKIVDFSITHGLTVEGEKGFEDEIEEQGKIEHKEEMARSLDRMSATLNLIRKEQGYYKAREKRHMQTLESNGSRLIWYTFFEIIILALVYGGQMYFLNEWFSERGDGMRKQWA